MLQFLKIFKVVLHHKLFTRCDFISGDDFIHARFIVLCWRVTHFGIAVDSAVSAGTDPRSQQCTSDKCNVIFNGLGIVMLSSFKAHCHVAQRIDVAKQRPINKFFDAQNDRHRKLQCELSVQPCIIDGDEGPGVA